MEIYITDDSRIGMRDIPPLIAELLRWITRWAEEECDDVEERLFPSPATGAAGAELRADWKALVEPELHEYFLSTRQVVDADLRGMTEEGGGFTLEFSFKHVDAWINALNQARLALAARHGFEEEHEEEDAVESLRGPSERELALFQMHVYGRILHWLLEILEEGEEGARED